MFTFANGNLSERQRFTAERLQPVDQAMDGSDAGGVDTVDDDAVRDAECIQPPQNRFGQTCAFGYRINHHKGEVRRLQGSESVGDQARRTRQIKEREAISLPREMRKIDFSGTPT